MRIQSLPDSEELSQLAWVPSVGGCGTAET